MSFNKIEYTIYVQLKLRDIFVVRIGRLLLFLLLFVIISVWWQGIDEVTDAVKTKSDRLKVIAAIPRITLRLNQLVAWKKVKSWKLNAAELQFGLDLVRYGGKLLEPLSQIGLVFRPRHNVYRRRLIGYFELKTAKLLHDLMEQQMFLGGSFACLKQIGKHFFKKQPLLNNKFVELIITNWSNEKKYIYILYVGIRAKYLRPPWLRWFCS